MAAPPHPPRVTGPRAPRLHVARPGPAMGVRRFPPDWQQEESPEGLRLWSRRPQRSPRTALRSLHKGPFSFHTALPSPASLFIPCQQCVKGKTSLGSRHGAGYLLSRSQPRQGLTAAKSQGLSRFGSLQSEKEPPCFLCCFFQTHQRRAACNPSGPKSLGGTRSPSGGAWHSPQSCGMRGATCTLPQH